MGECKAMRHCSPEQSKAYYAANRERIRAYQKSWYEKNKAKVSEKAREYRKAHKEQICIKSRKSHLKLKYCLSPQGYEQLLIQQESKCGICGISHYEVRYGLCVDHNHYNGKVRGLLCRNCNLLLGACKDKSSILWKAIKYLEAS